MTMHDPACPLCTQDGGDVLWRGPHLRVIEVGDADYPGYTRIVWNSHLAEMTSLSNHGRDLIMRAVYAVEQTQRDVLGPDKINLAALGNMVPHLHWHIIPRWADDRHFPGAIWAAPQVAPGGEPEGWQARRDATRALLPRYRDRLAEAMDALLWH